MVMHKNSPCEITRRPIAATNKQKLEFQIDSTNSIIKLIAHLLHAEFFIYAKLIAPFPSLSLTKQ
jgi:hypothetical protein